MRKEKNRKYTANVRTPHHLSGFKATVSPSTSFSCLSSTFFSWISPGVTGESRNIGNFSNVLTAQIAAINATVVAMNEVPITDEGLVEPRTANTPTTVTGIN